METKDFIQLITETAPDFSQCISRLNKESYNKSTVDWSESLDKVLRFLKANLEIERNSEQLSDVLLFLETYFQLPSRDGITYLLEDQTTSGRSSLIAVLEKFTHPKLLDDSDDDEFVKTLRCLNSSFLLLNAIVSLEAKGLFHIPSKLTERINIDLSKLFAENLEAVLKFALITLPEKAKEIDDEDHFAWLYNEAAANVFETLQLIISTKQPLLPDETKVALSKIIIVGLRSWTKKHESAYHPIVPFLSQFGRDLFPQIKDFSKQTTFMLYTLPHILPIVENVFNRRVSMDARSGVLSTVLPIIEFIHNHPQSIRIMNRETLDRRAADESMTRMLTTMLRICLVESASVLTKFFENDFERKLHASCFVLVEQLFSISCCVFGFLSTELAGRGGEAANKSTINVSDIASMLEQADGFAERDSRDNLDDVFPPHFLNKALKASAAFFDARVAPKLVQSALKLVLLKIANEPFNSATQLACHGNDLYRISQAMSSPFKPDSSVRYFPEIENLLPRQAAKADDNWFRACTMIFRIYRVVLDERKIDVNGMNKVVNAICAGEWDSVLNNLKYRVLKDTTISKAVEECCESVVLLFRQLIIYLDTEPPIDDVYAGIVANTRIKLFVFLSDLMQGVSVRLKTPYFSARYSGEKKREGARGESESGMDEENPLKAMTDRISFFRVLKVLLETFNWDYPSVRDLLEGKLPPKTAMSHFIMLPNFDIRSASELLNNIRNSTFDLTFGTTQLHTTFIIEWMRALHSYHAHVAFEQDPSRSQVQPFAVEEMNSLLEELFLASILLMTHHGVILLRELRGEGVVDSEPFKDWFDRLPRWVLVQFFAELHNEMKTILKQHDRYKQSDEHVSMISASTRYHSAGDMQDDGGNRGNASFRSLQSFPSGTSDESNELLALLKYEKPFKPRDMLKYVPEGEWKDVDPHLVKEYEQNYGPMKKMKLEEAVEFSTPLSVYKSAKFRNNTAAAGFSNFPSPQIMSKNRFVAERERFPAMMSAADTEEGKSFVKVQTPSVPHRIRPAKAAHYYQAVVTERKRKEQEEDGGVMQKIWKFITLQE